MSSIVYQSEFPHLISFKNPPQKQTDDLENDMNNNGGGGDMGLGGWSSFILTLATKAYPEMTAEETEYIHRPLVRWNQSPSSSSSLNIKSLEICTEGLGSESGSNIDELIDDLSNNNNPIEKQSSSPPLSLRSKKTNRNVISMFPPPLTSISGCETTRVRRYRESGRLVIKATISFSNSSFQAERVDGRLKLYSSSSYSSSVILEEDDIDNEEDEEEIDNLSEEEEEDDMEMKNEKLVEMEEFLRTSCKETEPPGISWGPQAQWVSIS